MSRMKVAIDASTPVLVLNSGHHGALGIARSGVLFLAANAPELKPWFVFPEHSLQLVSCLHNKRQMHLMAQQAGIPTPDAYFPESQDEVLALADHAVYPLILKSIDGAPDRSGATPIKPVVRDKTELMSGYQKMVSPGPPNLMIQEYVPGGKTGSWMFNGYFNAASNCLFGFTGKKFARTRPMPV